MPTRQKKCVNCKPPNDEHGSFDRNCQTRAIEMTITRMKIDRGISYGMARKMFDERVNNQKATYADMAAKQADDMAKSLVMELNTVKAKRQNIQKIIEETEEENNKLEEMAHRLVRAKEKQARIQEFIASMENEDQNQTHIPIMTTTTTYNKPQIKQNPTNEQTTPQTTSKAGTQKKIETKHRFVDTDRRQHRNVGRLDHLNEKNSEQQRRGRNATTTDEEKRN
jgi:hypothetical protein